MVLEDIREKWNMFKLLYFTNILGSAAVIFLFLYNINYELYHSISPENDYVPYILTLATLLVGAFSVFNFGVQPMLSRIVATDNTDQTFLKSKFQYLQLPYMLYLSSWVALIAISGFIINLTQEVFPFVSVGIGTIMLLLGFPTKQRFRKIAKLNSAEITLFNKAFENPEKKEEEV